MDPTTVFCPNLACPARGQRGEGNIHPLAEGPTLPLHRVPQDVQRHERHGVLPPSDCRRDGESRGDPPRTRLSRCKRLSPRSASTSAPSQIGGLGLADRVKPCTSRRSSSRGPGPGPSR